MGSTFLSSFGHLMYLNSIRVSANANQVERNSASEKPRLWREVNRVKIEQPKYVRYRSLSGRNFWLSPVRAESLKYNATVALMSGIVQRRRLKDVRQCTD